MNQPKKIQFQYRYFNLPAGGVENYILAGADYCRRRGIEARVLASQNPLRPAPGKEAIGNLNVTRHAYFHPPSPVLFFRPRLETDWLKKYIA